MQLAADRRARVPFALVAVLLLVSSLIFSSALSTREPPRVDRAVDESLTRVDADARLAVRAAVADAARAGAREPVTSPADTPAGRVLNDSRPFRDALRIRIYLQARQQLSAIRYRRDDVTARASLPAVPNAAALRVAKDRVTLASAANGTAIRATVRNVTLTATRANESVGTRRETYTVTVDSPVLAMHDRAVAFEERLNRGPVAGPGLGRQLTARLSPIAWSRGALQYGGAPIQNVVTNRHVALATNGGVLASQRAAFGQTDPDASDAYNRAEHRVAMEDVLSPTSLDARETTDAILPSPNPPAQQRPRPSRDDPPPDTTGLDRSSDVGPDEQLVVGVNHSADRALITVHDEAPDINTLIDEQYRATVRLETRVERIADPDPTVSSPGEEWTLVGVDRQRSTRVEAAPAPLPTATETESRTVSNDTSADERVFETHTRKVVEHIHTVRTWRRGEDTMRTRSERTRRTRVGIAVVGTYDPPGRAPDRSVDPLFERGGALDERNLAPVREAASTLVADRGGPDALARRAAAGSRPDETLTRDVAPPAQLDSWIRHDLTALRTDVREIDVTVDRGGIAAGKENPPRQLASILRDRRAELLDAPATYDGVGDRARIAARAVYLDAVIADLESRAQQHERTNQRLLDVVAEYGSGESPSPRESLETRSRATNPDREIIGNPSADAPPTGTATLVPESDPAYLTRTEIDRGSDPKPYHPLAARNLNVFTVPYGDAVDAVHDAAADEVPAGGTVGLGTAGRTLIAANRTLQQHSDRSPEAHSSSPGRESTPYRELATRRDDLNRRVEGSLVTVRSRAREVLGKTDAIDSARAAAAIRAAEARFDGRGHRAVAIENGTFARVLAQEAAARGEFTDAERDVLAARLRVAFADLSTDVRVPAPEVTRTTETVREVTSELLKSKAKDAAGNLTTETAENVLGEGYQGIPAGLPMLPVPGYWVATINVWHVQVRGTYDRFVLRAQDGTPTRPGGTSYVRDGSSVTLDVTGDGTVEHLGRSERIAFETSTVVVIAVPPSGRGVGDVDGNADERSAGWPCPGPEGDEGPPCTGRDGP